MNWQIKFTNRADIELLKSLDWYDEQSIGLGDKFEISVFKYIEIIRVNPFLFAEKKSNFRVAYLQEFPFLIIFKLLPKQSEILITSIFHTARNPKSKFRKTTT